MRSAKATLPKQALAEASHMHPVLLDETAYHALMAHGQQVVCTLSAEEGCTYLTPAWHKLTGFSVAISMGKQFFEKIHPHARAKLVKALLKYGTGKQTEVSMKCQIRHIDGSWLWVNVTLAGDSADQQPGRVLCLLTDISEAVETQKHLHRASLEAELALKARSEFLAHMSHELRTPLNAIMGFTQMMENEVFGPLGSDKYQDYVEHIKQSGGVLLSKLNDLFNIAHIEAGYDDLHEETVDVRELIMQAIEVHSHKAFQHQVKIATKLERALRVRADRPKLLKVLINLLSNAIKFNREGGQVLIGAHSSPKGLVITFSDTGHGMKNGQLQKIISSVQHEEGFLSRDRNHVGIGLALAAELVRLHGGSIDMDSEEGKGCHVSVHLPRERLLQARKTRAPQRVVELA